MDQKTRIKKLEALKEQYARTQALLVEAAARRKVSESTNLASLLEADLSKAEQILAGQDVVAKLQDMVEDLAQLSAKDVLGLADNMKETFGPEQAMSFEHAAQDSMTKALAAVRDAKDQISTALLRLEGKAPANDMAADAHTPAIDAGPDVADMAADTDLGAEEGNPLGDDFGAADGAAGPEDEPLGRARKESREGGRALTENFDMAIAGRKLLESESLDSLLDWVLNEAAAAMPADEFKGFARKVATNAAKNPEKTAGWIGKKKYGSAAMAQLAAPAIATDVSFNESPISLGEGKTFRKNDDDDSAKAEKFKGRKDARDRKAAEKEEDLDEGKTFRKGDDDDSAKAEKFKARDQERKAKHKGDDEDLDEGVELEEGPILKKAMKTAAGVAAAGMIGAPVGIIAKQGYDYHRAGAPGSMAAADDINAWNDTVKKVKKAGVEEGKTFRRGDDEDEEKAEKFKGRNQSRERKAAEKEEMTEAQKTALAMARIIEANILTKGRGFAAQVVKEYAANTLKEGDEQTVMEAFEAMFGMRPAAYSVQLTRELAEDLSPLDKKAAQGAMTKVAAKMATDKSMANKPANTALQGLDAAERNAANKVVNQLKKDGKTNAKVSDLVAGAEVETNESLDENINAAHWPVDDAGQYKGEPFQTDYGKLKAPKNPVAKTEGGEGSDTEVEEPKVDGADEAPKSEKAPPFKKAEEPKEEKSDESDEAK